MKFLETFRARLLIILAVLLVATLGVQYYLNLQVQEENRRVREMQERALVAGITLGFNGMQATDTLAGFMRREGAGLFDAEVRSRIAEIIVISDEWDVYDSLNPDYAPRENPDGTREYRKVSELTSLPPIVDSARLGDDLSRFPPPSAEAAAVGEAHVVPIQTDRGRFHVLVVLKSDRAEAASRAVRPLVYTLLVVLVSSAVTLFLVWRFSSPVSQLANAAKRVAAGDFSVRVAAKGANEMGGLSSRFNEMTAELEKKSGLEAKLQQAEREAVVGRLGASIAHEIRNPLNYINLSLDHLAVKFRSEDGRAKEEFVGITEQIKAEVRRIEARVGELLDYSRTPKPELRPTRVREVVDESMRLIEASAGEQGVTVGVTEEGGTPDASADREYLRSLFNNLFINALKAMEGGGKLAVSIAAEGDFVRIDVADTGEGIKAEDLHRIFEPYFSARKTGTGLGLAIVKRIVEVHGGTIEVESGIGKGTVFSVRLPMAKGVQGV
jgi:signal transduction histidine kinase